LTHADPRLGDAFGEALNECFEHETKPGATSQIIERDDGFIESGDIVHYFAGHDEWNDLDCWACDSVSGRVLDIGAVDATGVIRMWNHGAESLFGYDAASAIGQTLDLIVSEDFRERHWAGFRAAMTNGKTKLDQPSAMLPIQCGDGTVRRFPGRLIFLRDPLGHAFGAMGLFGPADASDADLASLPRV
jgi:PAS domain S-box-containing protein